MISLHRFPFKGIVVILNRSESPPPSKKKKANKTQINDYQVLNYDERIPLILVFLKSAHPI